MFKISVIYPNEVESRFDHEYYRDTHMPLVQRLAGDACKFYTIDHGVAGKDPDSKPPFVAMCHFYCESIDAFWSALTPHLEEIDADMPKYTNIVPLVQVSKVVGEIKQI
ncbi:EthD family reductase [Phyllobacterium sp. YR531]|uniref:EthD family reductase n=1 Tax=Phyllobacterium sp. YR531 TaxID=1144343 RepID=UPI00026F758E|nr:EthD family reductase [Phyllobacterium sp. YR531]EJN02074.1 hypothetical protein PMI41_02824 [Phyllobacterium sp. YR531]